MWAEALNEQQMTGEAINKVNEIRGSAGIAPLNSSAATTVTGQLDLRDRIRNERRVELAGKGSVILMNCAGGTLKEKVFTANAGVNQTWGDHCSLCMERGLHYYMANSTNGD